MKITESSLKKARSFKSCGIVGAVYQSTVTNRYYIRSFSRMVDLDSGAEWTESDCNGVLFIYVPNA